MIVTSLSHSSYSAVELIIRDGHLFHTAVTLQWNSILGIITSLSHRSYSAVELNMRDSHLSLTQELLCSGAHYEG